MADECLDEVNERTTSFVTVSFFDQDGAPVVPSSATYRIDRPQKKIAVLPQTAISPLGTTADLEITSAENRIYQQRLPSEVAEVTVEWDYGSPIKHGTAKYRYRIINLYGVVPVVSASVSPSSSVSPST
jgi:hypothetical protein